MTCVRWSAELQVPRQLCLYVFLRCLLIHRLPTARQSPPQAKRLDELEKMYKEEQVGRKRLFNLMEDMKGKIR